MGVEHFSYVNTFFWSNEFVCRLDIRVETYFQLFVPGFKCSDDKFTCNNSECVKKNLLCDGDFACEDGSDEDNCECPSSMFNCKEGGCLPATSVCDGTIGCSNGDDEKNCRKLICFYFSHSQ